MIPTPAPSITHHYPLRAMRQRGLNLIELGLVLLIVSLLVSGIYAKGNSISNEAKMQRVVDDAILLLTKSTAYRADHGDFSGISISILNSTGYSTAPIINGSGENPWGLNYALSADSSDHQLLNLSVAANSAATCLRLSNTLDGLVNNQQSISCDTANHTVLVKVR